MVEQRPGQPQDLSKYPFTPEEWERVRMRETGEERLLRAIGLTSPDGLPVRTEEEMESIRARKIQRIREDVSSVLSISINEVPIDNYEALKELEEHSSKVKRERIVAEILAPLSPVERRIIEDRFLNDQTREEVAKQLGRHRSGIGKIERRALRKLRHQRDGETQI